MHSKIKIKTHLVLIYDSNKHKYNLKFENDPHISKKNFEYFHYLDDDVNLVGFLF